MNTRLKVILPILVVVAGVAVAAVIATSRPPVERRDSAVPAPLVRAVTVELEDVALDVRSNGTVEPLTESTLVAQVPGQVVEVAPAFADGGFFRKGVVLLRIDPRDYRLQVAQAEAQVARARVAVEREQAEAELARQEWQDLGEGEPAALTLREPQLAEVRAALQAAEAALEQAHLNLARTEIRAPFDGRIRETRADLGQFVGAGTPVAAMFSTDYAEIRLAVTESDLAFLEVDLGGARPGAAGPEVRIRGAVAGRQGEWTGRIVRTDSQFDRRTRMLGLFARIEDPFGLRPGGGPPLPMGLFVEAQIAGRSAGDVVVLPRSALRGRDRVLVVEEDRLRFREVGVLRTEGDRVIVDRGLAPGERVCISALETVVDGMPVRVQLEDGRLRTDQQEEALL